MLAPNSANPSLLHESRDQQVSSTTGFGREAQHHPAETTVALLSACGPEAWRRPREKKRSDTILLRVAKPTFKEKGRPRLTWGREVYKHALSNTGSLQALHNFWQDTPAASAAWHAAVQRYCSTM